jgi:hypothetical protein
MACIGISAHEQVFFVLMGYAGFVKLALWVMKTISF